MKSTYPFPLNGTAAMIMIASNSRSMILVSAVSIKCVHKESSKRSTRRSIPHT